VFLLRLSGVCGAVEGGVDQQTHDGNHLGRGEHQAPAAGVGQVAGGCGVGGVVACGGPLGASDVETVVVIHSQDVLHGQDVPVGGEAQILLDALGNNARLEHVDGVLHRVGSGTTGQVGQLVVDNDAQTSEGCDFGVTDADTAATPGHCARGRQCRGAEHQHSDLLQVVSNGGVHGDRVDLFATLTQQVLGFQDVANGDVVGFGRGCACNGSVVLVGSKDASGGNATEQTQQLGLQGGSLQLVDCCGQLVADVSEGVSSGSELAEIICGVAEATVQDRHDLLVGGGALRGQVTSATGAPGRVAEDLLLSGVDGVMERHTHASTAGTGIQSGVALDDAALHPLRLLENAFRGVLKEFGAGNKIRQKSSAGIVFGNSSHRKGLKECLRMSH